MGRIMARVNLRNVLSQDKSFACDAMVDTGAAYMTLPFAWKNRLGKLHDVREIECETATQEIVKGVISGPVEIQLEGFHPVYGEVLFLEMTPQDGVYEPLVGYIPLEQSQAAVDMLGHRLIHGRKADLK